MSDLVSIAEVWRDRARVAEQAASDLDGLVESASNTVRRNYFGRDCVEGAALFAQLKKLLDAWCADVSTISTSLEAKALNCRNTALTYEAADESAGKGVDG